MHQIQDTESLSNNRLLIRVQYFFLNGIIIEHLYKEVTEYITKYNTRKNPASIIACKLSILKYHTGQSPIQNSMLVIHKPLGKKSPKRKQNETLNHGITRNNILESHYYL